MSEITPEKVAATPPTVELVADLLTEADNDYHDGHYWKIHLTASGNVVNIGVEASTEPDEDDLDDDGEWLPEVHFRAVVVEGEQTPVVLERPAELGLSWHDGGDLLALTKDGITLFPCGADEWSMAPENAREMAAHLAAMADAWETSQAVQNGGTADA